MCAMSRKGVSNCFAISLRFRFAIQLETRLETCLQWLLRSLQLEETEQLITMPVMLAMLQSKCSRVSELLGTESETCLRRCLQPLQLYGDQVPGLGLKPGLHISRKDRKHMVGNVYFKMHRYELQSLSLE